MVTPADRADGWRDGIDLDEVEVALSYLAPLLDAIYDTGSSMLIRVDHERRSGADPARRPGPTPSGAPGDR